MLANALSPVIPELPVRLIAWDGSAAGPNDAPLVELRPPKALQRLLWQPSELGAAQAYVTGEAKIHGDLDKALSAPDIHMRPVGETVAFLERAGLEVRDVHGMREHYVYTVAGWLERFEAPVDQLTDLVGEEVVRVWRFYLVGGSAAFRNGRMGVDQILSVRPGEPHTLPAVRGW